MTKGEVRYVIPAEVETCIKVANEYDFPFEVLPDGTLEIDLVALGEKVKREIAEYWANL
jgi:hypothetical protein